MDLSIQKLSKAFNRRKVLQGLTFDIRSGSRFAITGANGSGKSTLLKILSGGLLPSSGTITYTFRNVPVEDTDVYRYIHFVAPYNTVIEELTLPELFSLHRHLGLLSLFERYTDWVSRLAYVFDEDRQIKAFSSGMKQRVKLGLALLDDRPLILLDEPGSNLDAQGKAWMYALLAELRRDTTLVMASNDPNEIALCTSGISLDTTDG